MRSSPMVTTSPLQTTAAQAWPNRPMHHLFAADGRAALVAMDPSRMGHTPDPKLADLRRLAARCAEWGMPLLAEPIPVSFQDTSAHTVENVARAARIGAEAGADFVKVHYVGPVDQYRTVVDGCYVPLLVLGGAPGGEPRAALQMAAEALEAGARGVVFGRHVITHERPDRMVAALVELV